MSFVDTALKGVIRQLRLAGVPGHLETALSYHFDPGYSHGKQSKRKTLAAGQAAAMQRAAAEIAVDFSQETEQIADQQEDCSEEQLRRCAKAVSGLASLNGLAEYLTDALERGVAKPTPERLAKLGWAPAAQALLGSSKGGAFELGGGSGAGFQVICEGKGLATLGGGGGGGAFGRMRKSSMATRFLDANETLGGGAGGGMQLFFPEKPTRSPWEADRWVSWGSGGGYGCGSCKPGDEFCQASPLGITCGAKMDDTGAVREDLGEQAARSWREGVLRQCFESGRLAVIGGGGGGAGSALCCASVPRLKFGFGFHAQIRPGGQPAMGEEFDACCPDLEGWNATVTAENALGSNLAEAFMERRLEQINPRTLPSDPAAVDPFARENTGYQPPGHANQRPNLGELMRQHDQRLGVTRHALRVRATGQSCELPAWLNDTELVSVSSGSRSSPDGSGTKEPEVALRYIFKFNPLQGHLADGAELCGGWSDWCCVCHSAQWRIACLPETEKSAVDWFLTEDCCESKMRKDTSSPGFVADATPLRSSTVMWQPGVGWIEVPISLNASDSYHWLADFGEENVCTKEVPSDFLTAPPNAPAGKSFNLKGGPPHLREPLQDLPALTLIPASSSPRTGSGQVIATLAASLAVAAFFVKVLAHRQRRKEAFAAAMASVMLDSRHEASVQSEYMELIEA